MALPRLVREIVPGHPHLPLWATKAWMARMKRAWAMTKEGGLTHG